MLFFLLTPKIHQLLQSSIFVPFSFQSQWQSNSHFSILVVILQHPQANSNSNGYPGDRIFQTSISRPYCMIQILFHKLLQPNPLTNMPPLPIYPRQGSSYLSTRTPNLGDDRAPLVSNLLTTIFQLSFTTYNLKLLQFLTKTLKYLLFNSSYTGT